MERWSDPYNIVSREIIQCRVEVEWMTTVSGDGCDVSMSNVERNVCGPIRKPKKVYVKLTVSIVFKFLKVYFSFVK